MRFAAIFDVIIVLVAITRAKTEHAPKEIQANSISTKYIEQKLDNFNKTNEKTWQMRYLQNDEFYVSGGPLFVLVGGERTITPFFLTTGHTYDMAEMNNGSLIYMEHRFYGESKPTSDFTIESLAYLNANQSLADLANFIGYIKNSIPGANNSKVILVGGGYSGALVTWFRALYPGLTVGAWASSATLVADADFISHKEVTGSSMRQVGGELCSIRIRLGIQALETMFATRRAAEVKAMLQMCQGFDEENDLDIWTFFYFVAELFATTVENYTGYQIQQACDILISGATDVIGVAKFIVDMTRPEQCNDFTYNGLIRHLQSDLKFGQLEGASLQWYYQKCNEFGWYGSSNSKSQPFGNKFPITLFTTLCADLFGGKYTLDYIQERMLQTNMWFGGLDVNISNVYSTQGALDPWKGGGLDYPNAYVIPGYSHCMDLYSISDFDSVDMLQSKQNIAALVTEWLSS